jgi:hypothetical protein
MRTGTLGPFVLANYTHAIISPHSNFQVFRNPNRSVLLSVERKWGYIPETNWPSAVARIIKS